MTEQLDAATRAEALVDALGLLYHGNLNPEEFMLFPAEGGATIEGDGQDLACWTDAGGIR